MQYIQFEKYGASTGMNNDGQTSLDESRIEIQRKFDGWMSDELTMLQQWQAMTLMAL